MKNNFHQIDGHISSPQGFQAAGIAAGIKRGGLDMALITADVNCAAAGLYTSNRVQAAPVLLCRSRTPGANIRAIIINSGNANACTGEQGLRDAQAMARELERVLGLEDGGALVCSTGTIGRPMPMDRILPGIGQAAQALRADGGADAARAIMTTDTRPKQIALQFRVQGKTVTLAGMAKGAGMINPNMATMLAFLTTDVAIEPVALHRALARAVNQSFNCITVDGDQSTNDTVLAMASGLAGNEPLAPGRPGWTTFQAVLNAATLALAQMIVRDGEGATKFVTVRVKGAPSRKAADRVARAVANSLLVKTAWFGADPNWGRVIAAIGYAGVALDPALVDIAFDGLVAARGGQNAGLPFDELQAVFRKPEFCLDIDLHQGRGKATIYTCDCSEGYIKINASYMT